MPGDPEVLKRVMKLRSEKKLTLKELERFEHTL